MPVILLRMPDADELSALAHRHLWMHFSRQSAAEANGVPIIVKGDGHHIWDSTGKKYFDGLSGLFVVNAGQCEACGLCVAACPEHAIKLARNQPL